VVQHVRDPATAIGQVRRILRPGGLFGMAEPDWGTLAVTDDDVDTSRCFARFLASRVRNATIGRDFARLCVDAGLRVRSVQPIAVRLGDFGTADQILGLQRNTARAVVAGAILEAPAQAWLTRLAHSTFAAVSRSTLRSPKRDTRNRICRVYRRSPLVERLCARAAE
jgi:hypothetical protein